LDDSPNLGSQPSARRGPGKKRRIQGGWSQVTRQGPLSEIEEGHNTAMVC